MKKYIIISIIMLLVGTGVNAQSNFTYTASNPTGAFTNTAADTMYYRTTGASYNVISIQPIFTRATGTMAGTAILSCSNKGVVYTNTDTLTMTNAATNTTIWNKINAAPYWRIIRTGATTVTGTSAASISGR